MAYKILARPLGLAINSLRKYGTNAKFINVCVNNQTGIATVVMQKQPVNSLSYELLTELKSVLEDLDANKTRGLILTSVR